MKIAGKWHPFDDGYTRPIVLLGVMAAEGTLLEDRFLIDSGADLTAFSSDLLRRLKLPGWTPPSGPGLKGITGEGPYMLVNTALEFTQDDGRPTRLAGEFAAFTGPTAIDLSILGRDVLANFDVILSRPRNEIWLLSGKHQYQIVES